MKTKPNPMPVNPKCMYCGESVIWYEHSMALRTLALYPDLRGWKHVSPALWHCGINKSADVDLSQHEKETCIHCSNDIHQEPGIVKDGELVWKHTHGGWCACNNNMGTNATPKSASIDKNSLPEWKDAAYKGMLQGHPPASTVNIEKKSPKLMPTGYKVTGYNKCFYCGEAIEKRLGGEFKGHWQHSVIQDKWTYSNAYACLSSKTFDDKWHVADNFDSPNPNSTIKVTKETKTVVTKTQTVTYTVQVNDKLSVPENKGRKFRTE